MAGVDVAPGVDDADHRLAGPVGLVEAHLAQARAVAERAQVVDAEPAMAAQVFELFAAGHLRWPWPFVIPGRRPAASLESILSKPWIPGSRASPAPGMTRNNSHLTPPWRRRTRPPSSTWRPRRPSPCRSRPACRASARRRARRAA